MGISGLLPLLNSIHKHCSLKKFAGLTIGVDAYGWLHRGTAACAIELALDKPTTKYVDFAMSRVRMLLDFGVTPYLVFDGDALPNKEGTNMERRKRREESKALGLELYRAGKTSQAQQELQKATAVTHQMAGRLIEELKRINVQYVVAPYEADAQLAYLEQQGIINGILSEDSDLLVFGAKRLLTKLNQYGECVEIERADFALCKEISLTGWSDAMFRRMAILSGCDYLPNIEKMGLKTAYRYVRKYKDASRVIRMIQLEGKFRVPAEYPVRFQQADLTFVHHRVFCPIRRKMVFLTDLAVGMKEEDMPYLGRFVDDDIVIGVACGDLNPKTKEPMTFSKPIRPSMKENRRATVASTDVLKKKSSLDSFFKPYRQPLAELDPNSFTPSPSQQRLLQRHRDVSWEPRLVSSAPQLNRTVTSSMSNSSETRNPDGITDRNAFLARAAQLSTYQPPKRPRLCSDTYESPEDAQEEKSHFFSNTAPQASPLVQKKARVKKAKRTTFDIWSDDSVEDILLGLPNVQQAASPAHDNKPENSRETPDQDNPESVPQSSPLRLAESLAENPPDLDDSADRSQGSVSSTLAQLDTEIEPFEDLLESHLRTQRESLLKSFVYQSPSKQASALKSLASSKKSIATARTFSAQSTEKQLAALAKLPKLESDIKSNDSNVVITYPELPSEKTNLAENFTDRVQTEAEKIELAKVALTKKSSLQESLSQLETLNHDKTNTPDLLKGARKIKRHSPKSDPSGIYNIPLCSGSEDALIPNSEDEGSELEDNDRAKFDMKAFTFVSV